MVVPIDPLGWAVDGFRMEIERKFLVKAMPPGSKGARVREFGRAIFRCATKEWR
jgi:hypothetical protein